MDARDCLASTVAAVEEARAKEIARRLGLPENSYVAVPLLSRKVFADAAAWDADGNGGVRWVAGDALFTAVLDGGNGHLVHISAQLLHSDWSVELTCKSVALSPTKRPGLETSWVFRRHGREDITGSGTIDLSGDPPGSADDGETFAEELAARIVGGM